MIVSDVAHWLSTSSHWKGSEGVPTRVLEHLQYSLIAMVIAGVIALPLGLLIGHTGRGSFVIVAIANSFRALPTVGLLVFFYIIVSPHIHGTGDAVYLIPSEIVLVLLAIPPMLTNSYAGVEAVDAAARDSARGMGMTGSQVLLQVELPNALPLIMSGIRSAFLQVIATATVTAYLTLGGLGRYLFDGLSTNDYPQMASGAVLVAVLALIIDLILAVLQRFVVSRGVSGRFGSEPGAAGAEVLEPGTTQAGATEAKNVSTVNAEQTLVRDSPPAAVN